MTDLDTFINNKASDTIFRMYKYRRLYTPYEQAEKFSDESVFENGNYPIYVKIIDGIELPNGDVLLRLLEDTPINERTIDYNKQPCIYLYEKLSDIKLEEHEIDNEEE